MFNPLTATAALRQLQQGKSAQALVESCLQRISERESIVGAWQYFNPEQALQQAKAGDALQAAGKPLGALHGIPIAIKDNFATCDMPTGWGTPIHAGTQLGYDAAVVERLRSAGAILMGKTVLTEYAIARAGKTTNPHNPKHTPGGSSSGSAAAVADGMVPLAIGTQTVGSILRPAAYCGILGFKPSFGLISRYGVIPLSRELDHVGIFARSIEDIALIFSVLATGDGRDPDCCGSGFRFLDRSITPLPHAPKIAFIRGTFWSQVDRSARSILQHSADAFAAAGATLTEIELPAIFDTHLETVNALVCAGAAVNHGADYDNYPQQLSAQVRELIEQGRTAPSLAYAQARQATATYSLELAQILSEFDCILTPVTTGTAPDGLEDTGSSMFCALWSLCGLPAISVPAGSENGLPLAVQLVGSRGGDAKLLAIAAWAIEVLSDRGAE